MRLKSGDSLDTLSICVQTTTQRMLAECLDKYDVIQFFYLSRFLSCLPEDVASRVRAHEPRTIHEAVRLAHQFMLSDRYSNM